MSTQVQLHERTDEMTDEMLRSEGHLDSGMAGVMAQLTSTQDYFDELNDLLAETDSVIVGNDVRDEGVTDVSDIFEGVTEVDDLIISSVEKIVFKTEDIDNDVVEWLEEHEGSEVIAVHW